MADTQDVSRRNFVKTAGAAAAVVSAPRIQTMKAANDQVQYGFIGTGSPEPKPGKLAPARPRSVLRAG